MLTLDVGAGTFLPVKAEDTDDHAMHAEFGRISAAVADRLNTARAAGGRVIAVGTTSLRLLSAVLSNHGQQFEWKSPPYEYEFERLPIDLIIGDRTVRERIERLDPIDDISASWRDALARFVTLSRDIHLYD